MSTGLPFFTVLSSVPGIVDTIPVILYSVNKCRINEWICHWLWKLWGKGQGKDIISDETPFDYFHISTTEIYQINNKSEELRKSYIEVPTVSTFYCNPSFKTTCSVFSACIIQGHFIANENRKKKKTAKRNLLVAFEQGLLTSVSFWILVSLSSSVDWPLLRLEDKVARNLRFTSQSSTAREHVSLSP